ncbi:HEPN domain-containing protein [bacterium]|nr:HEPN domain-containing protein [bacterium]MBU1152415.1 HEPN domain-containing protein [bacterium]MBU2600492.1 HEPN domain-containing protein [bacterium]
MDKEVALLAVIDRWIKQALHDLENAKKNMEIGIYDVCLILCQQAVEKMLKALYIKKTGNESPPRIHSLRKLVEETNMSDKALTLVGELDSYYLALRYPDVTDRMPYEYCDQADANQGIKRAKEVIGLVETELEERQGEKKDK